MNRLSTADCDCGGEPHGDHCAAVENGVVEATVVEHLPVPTTIGELRKRFAADVCPKCGYQKRICKCE